MIRLTKTLYVFRLRYLISIFCTYSEPITFLAIWSLGQQSTCCLLHCSIWVGSQQTTIIPRAVATENKKRPFPSVCLLRVTNNSSRSSNYLANLQTYSAQVTRTRNKINQYWLLSLQIEKKHLWRGLGTISCTSSKNEINSKNWNWNLKRNGSRACDTNSVKRI